MTEGNINSCFNTDFSISDILPSNPIHRPIGTRELIFATKDYLDNRFRGIMRVNITDIQDKYLMVCPDYFAYFFRTLLCSAIWSMVSSFSFSLYLLFTTCFQYFFCRRLCGRYIVFGGRRVPKLTFVI